MRIPDEAWRCPNCGAGYEDGEGLCGPETWDEYLCECLRCGWTGHVNEVIAAWQRKQGRRPCPHCGGTGWVEAKPRKRRKKEA